MSATDLGLHNPRGLAGLMLVDLDPLWMAARGAEEGLVWERVALLCDHVNGQRPDGLPIVPVNSLSLRYLNGAAFCEGEWGVCGLYGTLCVREVVAWLRAQGARTQLLSDCIVWPPGARRRDHPAQTYFPDLDYPVRLRP